MNIPRPNPGLLSNFFSFDLIYGSPILSRISLGKPSPSSSMITSVDSLSELIVMKIFL